MFTDNLIFGYSNLDSFLKSPIFDNGQTLLAFISSKEFKDYIMKSKVSRNVILNGGNISRSIRSYAMNDIDELMVWTCANSYNANEHAFVRGVYNVLFMTFHASMCNNIISLFENGASDDFKAYSSLWLNTNEVFEMIRNSSTPSLNSYRYSGALQRYLMKSLAGAVTAILDEDGCDTSRIPVYDIICKAPTNVLTEPVASSSHYSKIFPGIISNAITSIISPSQSSTNPLCRIYYEQFATDRLFKTIRNIRESSRLPYFSRCEFYTIYSAITCYRDVDISAHVIGELIQFKRPDHDTFTPVGVNYYKSYISILESFRWSGLSDFQGEDVNAYITELENEEVFNKVVSEHSNGTVSPISESIDELEDTNDYSGPVLTQALSMLDKYSFDYIEATDVTVTVAAEASDYDKDEKRTMKRRERSEKLQKGAAKVYHGYKKYNDEANKIDSQITGITKTLAKKIVGLEDDKIRDEVIEGKKITVFGVLKKMLHTVAIFSVSKMAGVIAVVTHFYLGSKIKVSERKRICMELENEIKMVDEKIEDARQDGNRKAKYDLMRTRNNLQIALNKLRSASRGAKVTTAKNALKEANITIKTSREE